ncbi:MAG TPA: chemotaxis protein CheW [Gammaproteobacteria bacterium]|nr:chemotaxis protein CheW [Gammaproteobacteria bacterium]
MPQFGVNLLLPRASVVDLLDAEDMHIVVDLQGGIIGKIQWQGWTVPLISFEAASNDSIPKFNLQTKAVVIHSLADDEMHPYIALTVQGDPEVMSLTDGDIKSTGKEKGNDFIQSKVLVHAKIEAVIPDISTLVSYTSQYF